MASSAPALTEQPQDSGAALDPSEHTRDTTLSPPRLLPILRKQCKVPPYLFHGVRSSWIVTKKDKMCFLLAVLKSSS